MPIFAVPTTVTPPPPSVDWSGIAAMTWTGWDGSVWDLTGRTGGVSLQSGARGLGMPEFDRYASASPALAGSRWRGWRAQERSPFWPIWLYSRDGSQAWTEYDRAFWATLRPDRLGTWEVVQLDGTTRRLRCRFTSDGGITFDTLPQIRGWAPYPVEMVAEQPYWEGETISRSFDDGDPPQDFFGGDAGGGFGPPFFISSGSSLATATIPNPGDVDAYPIYVINGPSSSVSAGFAGNVVEYPVAIPDGETRTIDTSPDRLTVLDQDGVDRWADLGAQASFDAPIPPGASVPLNLSLTGTGSVSVSIVPKYFRAW